MSEARSSTAAYSVVAQIGHDSVAVVRPFPLPPSSSFSTLPFSKNRTENFSTNQSRCGLPTASASPGPGAASFQFFSTQIFGLNIFGGILATELFTGFFCPTTTVHLECVWDGGKNLGQFFQVPRGAAAAADLNACSVNPGFHFFPLHRFPIFDTAGH